MPKLPMQCELAEACTLVGGHVGPCFDATRGETVPLYSIMCPEEGCSLMVGHPCAHGNYTIISVPGDSKAFFPATPYYPRSDLSWSSPDSDPVADIRAVAKDMMRKETVTGSLSGMLRPGAVSDSSYIYPSPSFPLTPPTYPLSYSVCEVGGCTYPKGHAGSHYSTTRGVFTTTTTAVELPLRDAIDDYDERTDFRVPIDYHSSTLGDMAGRVPKDIRIQAMRSAAYMQAEHKIIVTRVDGSAVDSIEDTDRFRALWRFLATLLLEGDEPT